LRCISEERDQTPKQPRSPVPEAGKSVNTQIHKQLADVSIIIFQKAKPLQVDPKAMIVVCEIAR
jgi:hypothetical protein